MNKKIFIKPQVNALSVETTVLASASSSNIPVKGTDINDNIINNGGFTPAAKVGFAGRSGIKLDM